MAEEGEALVVRVIPMEQLRAVWDCKSLVALALYEAYLQCTDGQPLAPAPACPHYESNSWSRPAQSLSTDLPLGSDRMVQIAGDAVPCDGEPGVDVQTCIRSRIFTEWACKVQHSFKVKSILFQSLDMFGPNVGFIKFKADCVNRATSQFVPGVVFLRGHSVGILLELKAKETGDLFVMVLHQPRLPVPSFRFLEIPAGMVDKDGGFAGNAANELKEETGIEVDGDDLIELTGHDQTIKMSPGISDEGIKLYLHRKTLPTADIQALHDRETGVEDEGEQITVRVVPLSELHAKLRDAKSLAALALYNGMPKPRDETQSMDDVYEIIRLDVQMEDTAKIVHEPLLIEGSADPAFNGVYQKTDVAEHGMDGDFCYLNSRGKCLYVTPQHRAWDILEEHAKRNSDHAEHVDFAYKCHTAHGQFKPQEQHRQQSLWIRTTQRGNGIHEWREVYPLAILIESKLILATDVSDGGTGVLATYFFDKVTGLSTTDPSTRGPSN